MSATQATAKLLLPSWDHLRSQYIEPGIPATFVLRSRPHIGLFLDEDAGRLGIRMEGAAAADIPLRLSSMEIRDVSADGIRALELSVAEPQLFRPFFLFATDVAPRLTDGEPAALAVTRALDEWRTLLRQDGLLSEERQQGLYGELWVLSRLIAAGEDAVAAWTGPLAAAHDFRLHGRDIEVKTTRSARRVHLVNGLSQLTPAPDAPLFLLSLRVEDAGEGGRSLAEAVEAAALALAEPRRPVFWELVERSGYRPDDAHRYLIRWRLADPPRLVPVDDRCPRLTRKALGELPAFFRATRILDVSYQIDVDGMGVPDGSDEFLQIIPAA